MAETYRREPQKRQEDDDKQTALARAAPTELTRRGPAPEKHHDERTVEIRASIDQARRQIAQSLDDIEATVRDKLDWRSVVADHPYKTIGVGFAIGLYLGIR
ncbi:MAG: hypothetical protein ACOCV2_01655 [Persicimonas sp.]